MAAVPPSASHCSVLHFEHDSRIRQDGVVEPEAILSHHNLANIMPLCALSDSGELLALTYNTGFVSIHDR